MRTQPTNVAGGSFIKRIDLDSLRIFTVGFGVLSTLSTATTIGYGIGSRTPKISTSLTLATITAILVMATTAARCIVLRRRRMS